MRQALHQEPNRELYVRCLFFVSLFLSYDSLSFHHFNLLTKTTCHCRSVMSHPLSSSPPSGCIVLIFFVVRCRIGNAEIDIPSNSRLAFLGEKLLQLITCSELYHAHAGVYGSLYRVCYSSLFSFFRCCFFVLLLFMLMRAVSSLPPHVCMFVSVFLCVCMSVGDLCGNERSGDGMVAQPRTRRLGTARVDATTPPPGYGGTQGHYCSTRDGCVFVVCWCDLFLPSLRMLCA